MTVEADWVVHKSRSANPSLPTLRVAAAPFMLADNVIK
jgi:hypothetical protein